MKNKKRIANIAVLALMLTAASCPIAASAATNSMPGSCGVKLIEAGNSGTFSDTDKIISGKIGLANKYEPDTVITETASPLPMDVHVFGQTVSLAEGTLSGSSITLSNQKAKLLTPSNTKTVNSLQKNAVNIIPNLKVTKIVSNAVPVPDSAIHIVGELKDVADESLMICKPGQ